MPTESSMKSKVRNAEDLFHARRLHFIIENLKASWVYYNSKNEKEMMDKFATLGKTIGNELDRHMGDLNETDIQILLNEYEKITKEK